MEPVKILEQYWGYKQFRPLQEDIVKTVLAGNDLLALLPTGGGKSICFQVPGLMLDGVCIVVSPLIALMKDQVTNLKKKGIKADLISSANSYRETDILLDNAVYGNTKFLYVSPERLKNELFLERLKRMKVGVIAIDEAHCISQWGYDFRPAYLEINSIREILPEVPMIALTATATPEVANDIIEKLNLRSRKIIQKSFRRDNLSYKVSRTENKSAQLLRELKSLNGSAIIYVRSRHKTKVVSDFLNENGFSSAYYHAGLSANQREESQNAWLKNEKQIMVSTNAFGMGIDKPDVRLVVHLDLPPDPESYYQESGRAGRDGKMSWVLLMVDDGDLSEASRKLEMKYPPVETIRRVYQAMGNFFSLAIGSGEGKSFLLDSPLLAKNFNIRPTELHYSLQILEKHGLIVLSESASEGSRIFLTVSREQLYQFQVINTNLDQFIKILLRSYGGVFDQFVKINEEELERRSGLSKAQIIKNLKFLDKSGLLIFSERTDLPKVTYMINRVDAATIKPSRQIYEDMKEREKRRLQAMFDYVKLEKGCRANVLLNYFGENPVEPCGLCDLCMSRPAYELPRIILKKLEEGQTKLSDLVFQLKEWKEEEVIYAIRSLLDEKLILKNDEDLYSRPKA